MIYTKLKCLTMIMSIPITMEISTLLTPCSVQGCVQGYNNLVGNWKQWKLKLEIGTGNGKLIRN